MFLVPPLQVAVTVAAILTVVYFFTRPALALFSIFCVRAVLDLLWWIPGTIAGLNMLQLFTAAAFVLVAAQLFLDLKRVQEHPHFKLFLMYIVLMVIAIARSHGLVRNLDSIVRYTAPFTLFFMVSIYFKERHMRAKLLLVVACIGVIPLTTSLYHMASGQMNQYSLAGYNRLLGGYKNLHNMALMSLFFLTLWTFWLVQVRANFKRLVLMTLIGLGTLSLYMTYIRTGLLGWAVFLGFGLLFQKQYRTLGVAMGLGALIVLFSGDIQDRFGDLLLIFDDENITLDKRKLGSGRWGLWTLSMNEFLSQPPWDLLLGSGLGGQREMTLDWVKLFHSKHITLDPHNDMLLLLYQIGPFGVLIYLAMQWKVLTIAREVWNAPNADRFARSIAAYSAALTVTVFVTNAISNSFVHRTSPGWYYWCVCGLLVAEYAQLKGRDSAIPGKLEAVQGRASA